MKTLLQHALNLICNCLGFTAAGIILLMAAFAIFQNPNGTFFKFGASTFLTAISLSGLAFAHVGMLQNTDRTEDLGVMRNVAERLSLSSIVLLLAILTKLFVVVFLGFADTNLTFEWLSIGLKLLAQMVNVLAFLLTFISITIGTFALQSFSMVLSKRGFEEIE